MFILIIISPKFFGQEKSSIVLALIIKYYNLRIQSISTWAIKLTTNSIDSQIVGFILCRLLGQA